MAGGPGRLRGAVKLFAAVWGIEGLERFVWITLRCLDQAGSAISQRGEAMWRFEAGRLKFMACTRSALYGKGLQAWVRD